jgi:hypothetical protein
MYVGADIAINHGALVNFDGKTLCVYDDGKGMMSSTEDLWNTACLLSRNTPLKSTVLIDWDRKIGSWGGADTAVLITLQIGFYAALAQTSRKCDVHFVTPSTVRFCLGVDQQLSKKDLHTHAKTIYNMPDGFPNDRHGDLMDAWLLAMSWACAQEQYTL